jgi:hypothetical protein
MRDIRIVSLEGVVITAPVDDSDYIHVWSVGGVMTNSCGYL